MPYGPLEVLQSARGFYIGRIFTHSAEEGAAEGLPEGFMEPGSRESGYFGTREEAAAELAAGLPVIRKCVENDGGYDKGIIPDLRIGRSNPGRN